MDSATRPKWHFEILGLSCFRVSSARRVQCATIIFLTAHSSSVSVLNMVQSKSTHTHTHTIGFSVIGPATSPHVPTYDSVRCCVAAETNATSSFIAVQFARRQLSRPPASSVERVCSESSFSPKQSVRSIGLRRRVMNVSAELKCVRACFDEVAEGDDSCRAPSSSVIGTNVCRSLCQSVYP